MSKNNAFPYDINSLSSELVLDSFLHTHLEELFSSIKEMSICDTISLDG